MKTFTKPNPIYGLTLAAALLLGGCTTLASPSEVEVERIQVSEGYSSSTLRQGDISDDTWTRIINEYHRSSTGPMNVYVSYPAELKGADEKAARVARRYGRTLTSNGVDDVIVSTVPSYDSLLSDRVVISYRDMDADAPKGCAAMPGAQGAQGLYEGREYQLGCGNMKYISKMVSDPTDLLGKKGVSSADSRRVGNVVERYRSGAEFEPLRTSNSSDVGR